MGDSLSYLILSCEQLSRANFDLISRVNILGIVVSAGKVVSGTRDQINRV